MNVEIGDDDRTGTEIGYITPLLNENGHRTGEFLIECVACDYVENWYAIEPKLILRDHYVKEHTEPRRTPVYLEDD